jgi:tetratricopeptide (TPR) repeat protein
LANNPNFKIEYSYRLARCFQALKNQSEAIKSFTTVLSQAKSTESYITCNTALQLGSIYEAQGKNTQAKSYYDLCLSINSPEYKNSLHQRAKAGLERLSQ